ncbi:hypothetical protein OLT15_04970, partial [Campylobacter jejuni]|nr:hypothetical protein [Campylobacter jejuni]
NPKTKILCEIEVCLDIMLNLQKIIFLNLIFKIIIDLRNFLLRRMRRIVENIINNTDGGGLRIYENF